MKCEYSQCKMTKPPQGLGKTSEPYTHLELCEVLKSDDVGYHYSAMHCFSELEMHKESSHALYKTLWEQEYRIDHPNQSGVDLDHSDDVSPHDPNDVSLA
jgi:hypothetical protein